MVSLFVQLFAALMIADAHAGDIRGAPVQARVFVGTGDVDPEDLNTELSAEGLKTVKAFPYWGAEAVFTPLRFLHFGIRYQRRSIDREEETGGAATFYAAQLRQDSVMGTLRIPVIKTALIRADAFAGYGGANTTLKLTTATQDGELSRKDDSGWFKSTVSAYGASVAIGWRAVYLVVEAGVETNKVDEFKRTGTVNNNIQEIDLSGSFVTVGLLFDGATWKKR